jgi:hypothetical protein
MQWTLAAQRCSFDHGLPSQKHDPEFSGGRKARRDFSPDVLLCDLCVLLQEFSLKWLIAAFIGVDSRDSRATELFQLR